MSEERDEKQESATLNGLGEIENESSRDPFTRGWPQPVSLHDAVSGGIDLESKAAAQAMPKATRAESTRALEILAEVRSIFDSRPVNGFDGFLSGFVVVEPTVTVCTLLAVPPAPVDYPEGAVGLGTYAQAGVSCVGCGPLSQGLTDASGFAGDILNFSITAGNAVQVNIYLFVNGVLVDSFLDVDASTLPSVGSTCGDGDVVVGAITCVNSGDTFTGDIELTLVNV